MLTTLQREVARWKRKFKQMEKHYLDADLVAQSLGKEVKELRGKIEELQLFEREATDQIEELSENLLASTEEIDEKTVALTEAMNQLEVKHSRKSVIAVGEGFGYSGSRSAD